MIRQSIGFTPLQNHLALQRVTTRISCTLSETGHPQIIQSPNSVASILLRSLKSNCLVIYSEFTRYMAL